jgi:nucleoside phosphorylase
MPMELTPLKKKLSLKKTKFGSLDAYQGALGQSQVVAIVTGMGTRLATEGLEHLLHQVELARVVVVGITGAIENETPIGTIVFPELVVDGATGEGYRPDQITRDMPTGKMWTSDVLITDPDRIAGLQADGVVALDMETAALARISERHQIPWSVFRAISDRASDGSLDEEVFQMSNQDGTLNAKSVASFFVRHPGRLPAMARLSKGARLAADRAASAAVDAVARLEQTGIAEAR